MKRTFFKVFDDNGYRDHYENVNRYIAKMEKQGCEVEKIESKAVPYGCMRYISFVTMILHHSTKEITVI